MNRLVMRDEREQAIDRDADRLTAAVLSFGLLGLVIVRSLRGEAAWDLLALVVIGGAVGAAYRVRSRATDRRWLAAGALAAAIAALAAVALVMALVTRS